MTRYSDYRDPPGPTCAASAHKFAMNGLCWRCNRSVDVLVEQAVETLKRFDPERLAPPDNGATPPDDSRRARRDHPT